MNALPVRIGATVIALALVAAAVLTNQPWLGLMAVLVVVVAVAFLR